MSSSPFVYAVMNHKKPTGLAIGLVVVVPVVITIGLSIVAPIVTPKPLFIGISVGSEYGKPSCYCLKNS